MDSCDPTYPTLFDSLDYVVTWRDCPRCIMLGYPGRYPEVFFPLKDRRAGQDLAPRRSRFCEGCIDETQEDRALRNSIGQRIRDHAKRHGTPIGDYCQRYGLTIDRVLAWYKAKVSSGSLDCGCAVRDMRHGSKDVEMHQTNPAEPFFPQTWRLYCTNDHRMIARSSEADYAAKKRGWELWKQSRLARTSD